MLLFGKELYVLGCIAAGFVHKQFIKKNNYNIDIILMISKEYEKYRNELLLYFDKIFVIDMLTIKLDSSYVILEKYNWMEYSINKWQALKFIEYDKILFIDIDVLPLNEKLYDIFDHEAPAFLSSINEYRSINKLEFLLQDTINNEEYSTVALKLKNKITASFILIKPNIKEYNEYFNVFIKMCEGSSGYISLIDSGPDESSILLYYLFYKNIKCHYIPYDYSVISWDRVSYNINNVRSINYLSWIKPWVKLPFMQWGEENIWYNILHIITKNNKIIKELLIKIYIEELIKYFNYIKESRYSKRPKYYLEILNNTTIYNKINNIISLSQKKDLTKLSYNEKYKIIKYLEKIYKGDETSIAINNKSIYDIIT